MARIATLLAATALLLSACGDATDPAGGDSPAAKDFAGADSDAVEVIDGWSRALSEGDIEAAAEYFGLPSLAENGAVLRIESTEDAVRFNQALPCGAELIEATTNGEFTTATFELDERPGPGECGPGVGGTAQTSFVIEDGKIIEWRRVGLTPPDGSEAQA